MHDGKAETTEFGLLHEFTQNEAIPHEPRICLQSSTVDYHIHLHSTHNISHSQYD